ncbi:MAG: crossover junction endodeoxyribonuclease RuvC [Planctomycetota bacterium]|jgi:crossover junction endodeoxyribonuclease RuvC|nr:crossover junction endodeoxyribonuclease RuvC [Planctomycetota bacterium]
MDSAWRIIGIDPGTRHVGYGVVESRGRSLIRLASGCVAASDSPLPARLAMIFRTLREVMEAYAPEAAAVETVFSGKNPKTAIAIGEGRGVAVLAAAERGLEVRGYEPALVKRAVAGSGRAGKEQMRRMVGILLSLREPPATDHEADALALAITHARHMEMRFLAGGGRAAALRARPERGRLPEAVLRQLPAECLDGRGKRR